MTAEHAELATNYLSRLEARDWAGAKAMCTATATVWHNDGTGDQSIAENLAAMQDLSPSIESLRYQVVRQFTSPDEVLQQHIAHVNSTQMSGAVHAAAYFRFTGGLIDRIEEYANFVPSSEVPGLDRTFWEQRWATVQGAVSRPNQTLVDAAAQLEPGTALDAGCGQGTDAIHLAERGWTVTAVDFVDAALDQGRERSRQIGPEVAARITWQQGDLNTWMPTEGDFDLVTVHFLHGVSRRDDMFRRLAAAVRPGGTLLIVGHHPENNNVAGGNMPEAVFFTTRDVTKVLDDGWTLVTVDDDHPRHVTDREGRDIRLRAAHIRAQRR